MKRILAMITALVLLLGCAAAFAEAAPEKTGWTTEFTAHCATVEEGRELMRGRTLFHDQITESTLGFFLQRKGGTLEDYIEYSADQVMALTPFTMVSRKLTTPRTRGQPIQGCLSLMSSRGSTLFCTS